MAGPKAKDPDPIKTPDPIQEPNLFKVGPFTVTEGNSNGTHSDVSLDCDTTIDWGNQHLSRFKVYFNGGGAMSGIAESLANELVTELKAAVTLAAQEGSPHPPA